MWSTIYIEESKEQANGPLMWSTERIILTNYIQESKELEHKPLMFRRKKYSVLIFKRHILYCRVKKCKQIKIVRCSKKKTHNLYTKVKSISKWTSQCSTKIGKYSQFIFKSQKSKQKIHLYAEQRKKVMVRLRGPSGLGVQWPIILPPLEAGSCRCSVKPASRCACHIMDREAQLSHRPQPVHYATWNGRASNSTPRPGPQLYNSVHITLMPPTRVTSSRNWARQEKRVETGI